MPKPRRSFNQWHSNASQAGGCRGDPGGRSAARTFFCCSGTFQQAPLPGMARAHTERGQEHTD
eukprot:14088755-Alexandrium_andersonii.AAC.1